MEYPLYKIGDKVKAKYGCNNGKEFIITIIEPTYPGFIYHGFYNDILIEVSETWLDLIKYKGE
jgi:hypothetical protein